MATNGKNKIDKRKYTSPAKAALRLGVSTKTVRKWLDDGMLRGYAFPGSNHRRIEVASVDELIAKMQEGN